MDRIQHPTAVETRPSYEILPNSKKGYATGFNPVTKSKGTENLASQYNAIQETLMHTIETANLTGDHNDDSLLTKAIQSLGSIPVGTEAFTMQSTAPSGWLFEEGQLLSREIYSSLWSYANNNGLLVTEDEWETQYGMFSNGDDETTFRLPDMRGQFIRVHNNGADIDPDASTRKGGDSVGSLQSFAMENIIGSIGIGEGNVPNNTPVDPFYTTKNSSWGPYSGFGATNSRIDMDLSRSAQTSTETRPANIYKKLMIKY